MTTMIDVIQVGTQVTLLIVAFKGLSQIQEAVTQKIHAKQRSTLEWLEKYTKFTEEAEKSKNATQKRYKRIRVELKEYTFK